MNAFPNVRFFRLSADGARCDATGLFVGHAPLLHRTSGDRWTPRDADEIDADLSVVYGQPVETAAIRGRLVSIADALTRGDIPRAAITALHIRFPDPPGLEKGDAAEAAALAAQLAEIGLLKGSWDPDKHPRLGGPPNAGWFAPKTDADQSGQRDATESKDERLQEERLAADAYNRRALARTLVREAALIILGSGTLKNWVESEEVKIANKGLATLEIAEILIRAQERTNQMLRASQDPPKTLQELQSEPTENWMGYELHHIVEQNPDNIAKSPGAIAFDKFGRKIIDDPDNLVWIPKFKHELITGYYNSADRNDPTRLHRDVVNAMDFAAQRAAGLDALRRYGVLK
jgi:hypothetical protein